MNIFKELWIRVRIRWDDWRRGWTFASCNHHCCYCGKLMRDARDCLSLGHSKPMGGSACHIGCWKKYKNKY